MSNALAIAAVTAAIRRRLADNILVGLPPNIPNDLEINNARVTSSPPDRARTDNRRANQVNLHLYRVEPNAALRNHDFPPPLGGSGPGPLALDLHYLLSVYPAQDDDLSAHIVLAQALRILHERPVIGPPELRQALGNNVSSDTSFAFEAVRLTLAPLSLEDFNRLWSVYQTPARLSCSLLASVVLLETRAPRSAPLPVLAPNFDIRPDTFTYPAIEAIELPQSRPFALLGDAVTLRGRRLTAPRVEVRLVHPRLASPVVLTPTSAGDNAVTFAVPTNPRALPPGPYSLTLALIDGTDQRTTDARTLALAPEITSPIPANITPGPNRTVNLTVAFRPEVRPGQRVALLFGDREIALPPATAATSQITFSIPDVAAGVHFVRLRVDGVDSDILDRTTGAFATNRRTTVA